MSILAFSILVGRDLSCFLSAHYVAYTGILVVLRALECVLMQLG